MDKNKISTYLASSSEDSTIPNTPSTGLGDETSSPNTGTNVNTNVSGGGYTQVPTDAEFKGNMFDSMMAIFGRTTTEDSYIDSSGTIYFKDKNPQTTDPKYNDTVLNITDPKQAAMISDNSSNLHKDRRTKPLSYEDTIKINKRTKTFDLSRQDVISEYNLRLGDSVFVIPPEYIQVNDTSHTKTHVALRQSTSYKTKTGHSNRDIIVTLYFNGIDQINGTTTDSPFEYDYHMDGLLSLIAQFKCTPFLPVQNEYLNNNFNIFTVALQSMNVQAVQGFPGCLSVTLVMQEFLSTPYTEVHDIMYDDLIDWDLFRYYYQRYKNNFLKPIKDKYFNGKFEVCVLDKDKLMNAPDKVDLNDSSNYIKALSDADSVEIVDFGFAFSNILTNLQLQGHGVPSIQYLGGSDITFNLTFETTDVSVVQNFNYIATHTQMLTRDLNDYKGIGFVKIENEISKMLGVSNFMVNAMQINTVPEFPDLNVITMECVSYDIGSSKDVLTGMTPFEKGKKGTLNDTISKKASGVFNKIKQDNVIERKMMELELYPDLYLPKYSEVNNAISKIRAYKSKHGLPQLPYTELKQAKTFMPGVGPNAGGCEYVDPDFYYSYPYDLSEMSRDIFEKASNVVNTVSSNEDKDSNNTTSYKSSYTNYISEDGNLSKVPFPQSLSTSTVVAREYAIGESEEEYAYAWRAGNYTYSLNIGSSNNGEGNTSDVGDINIQGLGKLTNITGNALADLMISMKDVSWYVWGGEGQIITASLLNSLTKVHGGSKYTSTVWSKVDKGMYGWDCSGFIRWALKQLGVKNKSYSCTSGAMYQTVDKKISKSDLQPGDLLWHSGHVAIYAGDGKTIEARSPSKGVGMSVIANRFTGFGRFNGVPNTNDVLTKMNGGSVNSNSSNNDEMPTDNQRRQLKYDYRNIKTTYAPIDTDGNKLPSSSNNNSSSNSNTSSSNGFTNGIPNLNHPDANKDWGHGFTAQMLDAHLRGSLSGSGKYWVGYGNIYKTDPALMAAISIHETGNGTSNAIKNKNNPCGIMVGGKTLKVFSSLQEGIRYSTSNIARNYIPKGKRTLSQIGAMYAPIGAANDPTGSNKNWVSGVNKFYKQITGRDYDPNRVGTGVKNELLEAVEGGWSSDGSSDGGGNIFSSFIDKLIGNFTAPPEPPKRTPSEDAGKIFSANAKDLFKKGKFATAKQNKTQSTNTYSNADMGDNFGGVAVSISKNLSYKDDDVKKYGTPMYVYSPINYCYRDLYQKLANNDYTLPDTEMFPEQNESNSRKVGYSNANIENDVGFNTTDNTFAGNISNKDIKKNEYKPSYGDVSEDTVPLMCVDMVTYSHNRRMSKAFPSFLFMVADDGGDWVDCKKLWSNFYAYKPVIDIRVHQDFSMPAHTATVTLSNIYNSLDHKTSPYEEIKNLTDNKVAQWIYDKTGMLLCSPKITQSAVDAKNELFTSFNLREGGRIHIRMGYGSNAFNLPICFNGNIAELSGGEVVTIVAQSDGVELANNIISTKEGKGNTLIKYGSEPSNVIGSLLVERENKWLNILNEEWGERSKYGIEHFGIHLGYNRDDASSKEYDLLKNIYLGLYNMVRLVEGEWKNAISNIGNGERKDEDNINVFLYNKTPWDSFKMFEQSTPEFLCQPCYHQFESRLFYGLPTYLYSYRYDACKSNDNYDLGGVQVYESVKTFSQFHYIDNLNSIVDNSIKASSKDLYTNAVVTYSLGGNLETTPVLYSDRSINGEYQKTKVIDSSINQDYWGPDKAYQIAGFAIGKNGAIHTGISNLIDSWYKSYKGNITILGDASIKPCDYVYMSDPQSQMYGTFGVREVIHEFTMSTGFTTTITPGLVGTTSLKNSGMNNIIRSLTTLGGSMMANYYVRAMGVKTMTTFINSLSISKAAKHKLKSKLIGPTLDVENLTAIARHYDDVVDLFKTGKIVDRTVDVIKGAKNVVNSARNIKNAVSIKNAATSVSTAIKVAGNMVPGVGTVVSYIVATILIDWMINSIIEEFMYNNCVNVHPLIFKDKVFVAGAKGHSSLVPGCPESNINMHKDTVDTLGPIIGGVNDALTNEDGTETNLFGKLVELMYSIGGIDSDNLGLTATEKEELNKTWTERGTALIKDILENNMGGSTSVVIGKAREALENLYNQIFKKKN